MDDNINPRYVFYARALLTACVNVTVCGREHETVCDSGADCSLIRTDLVNGVQLQPCGLKLIDVNGQELQVAGQLELEVVLGNECVRHVFVVADVASKLLLGLDFLSRFHCVLDFSNSCLVLRDSIIPFRIKRVDNTVRAQCCAAVLEERLVDSALVDGRVAEVKCNREDSGLMQGVTSSEESSGLGKPVRLQANLECSRVIDGRFYERGEGSEVSVRNARGAIDTRIVDNTKESCGRNYEYEGINPNVTDIITVVDAPGDIVGTVPRNVANVEPERSIPVANYNTDTSYNIAPERIAALRKLMDGCKENLTIMQQTEVWQLLTEFAEVFSIDETDVGRTDLIKHRIITTDDVPVKIPPRRLPIAKRDLVQREIDRWAELGIIQESRSAYSAPVVLVQRGPKVRLCIDYRRLNDKTVQDAIPTPNIDTILDMLSGSTYFSCLDLRSGFLQIPVDPRDVHKTAFCTENQLWEFLYTPFGLTGSPSACVRLIEIVFNGMSPKALLAFIDDVMVHASTFEQELINLREALTRLKRAGLKVNIQKARLFQRETKFLGHVVSGDGVRPDEDKVKAVVTWPTPQNVAQLRSWLGLCAYERRFICNYSHVAQPLYELTKKRAKFHFGEPQKAAFDELKRLMSTAPVLAHYDPEAELILESDCSLHGAGSILLEVINGQERVVAYYSKLLSKSQRNYCATKRELYAIVASLAHFHVYLYGHKRFVVRTDHSSLRWLLNFKDLEGLLARWLERIQLYDFEIQYRAGSKIPAADALSRRPCTEDNCRHCQQVETSHVTFLSPVVSRDTNEPQAITVEDYIVDERAPNAASAKIVTNCINNPVQNIVASDVLSSVEEEEEEDSIGLVCLVGRKEDSDLITTEQVEPADTRIETPVNVVRVAGIDLGHEQCVDAVLGEIVQAKLSGAPRPKWEDISGRNAVYKAWWSDWEALEMHEGLLCRRWIKDSTNAVLWLPAVPAGLQAQVLTQVHDGVGAGHFGRRKTLLRLKEAFYWPQRSKAVIAWCRDCSVCARRKGPVKRQHGPMQRYSAGTPMERVGIDVLGPMPVTDRGNRYLLVAVDYFTKWPEAIPMPNQEATTIAEALVSNFFCRFGACMELHSDQGRNFESAVLAEVCKIFGVHKTRTTALYPQSDGLVERFNRTLLNSLAAYVSEHQRDWDLHTPLVLLAYRTAVHEATGVSPCEAMLGRPLRGPLELVVPRPVPEHCTVDSQYVSELIAQLESVQQYVRANLDLAGLDLKRRYDRNADRTGFQPGDAVWLYNPRVPKGRSPKLGRPWTGPHRVVERLTDVVYRIQSSPRAKPYTVNRYRLWRVTGSLPEDWWAQAGTLNARPADPDETEITSRPDLENVNLAEPPDDQEGEDADTSDTPDEPIRTTRSGRMIRRPRRFQERGGSA